MKKILLIDDTVMLVGALDMMMSDLGFEVEGVSDPFKGEALAIKEDYDLIAIDLRMPHRNGAEIIENIKKAKPSTRIVVMTGYPDDPMVERSLKAGALGIIPKPFRVEKLIQYLPA